MKNNCLSCQIKLQRVLHPVFTTVSLQSSHPSFHWGRGRERETENISFWITKPNGWYVWLNQSHQAIESTQYQLPHYTTVTKLNLQFSHSTLTMLRNAEEKSPAATSFKTSYPAAQCNTEIPNSLPVPFKHDSSARLTYPVLSLPYYAIKSSAGSIYTPLCRLTL